MANDAALACGAGADPESILRLVFTYKQGSQGADTRPVVS
jgi:hypothetical protein